MENHKNQGGWNHICSAELFVLVGIIFVVYHSINLGKNIVNLVNFQSAHVFNIDNSLIPMMHIFFRVHQMLGQIKTKHSDFKLHIKL